MWHVSLCPRLFKSHNKAAGELGRHLWFMFSAAPLSVFSILFVETRPHITISPLCCLRKGHFWIPPLFYFSSRNIAVNYKKMTFPVISLLQSAGAGQPGLIVKHVHANQASPKWRLLSQRYNEPPERLQLWGVIAVHSPEARLYSISSNTIWTAEAACSARTYSKMHAAEWAALLLSGVSFPRRRVKREEL